MDVSHEFCLKWVVASGKGYKRDFPERIYLSRDAADQCLLMPHVQSVDNWLTVYHALILCIWYESNHLSLFDDYCWLPDRREGKIVIAASSDLGPRSCTLLRYCTLGGFFTRFRPGFFHVGIALLEHMIITLHSTDSWMLIISTYREWGGVAPLQRFNATDDLSCPLNVE